MNRWTGISIKQHMFADGIAFMCFCDTGTQSILSVIAMLLVHLFGERNG